MAVNIILVEENDVTRVGIRSLLVRDPEFVVLAEVRSGPEAIALCSRLSVDLVIMGVDAPAPSSFECIRLLKRQSPNLKVLVLCMQNFESYLLDMLRAGADGYLLKNAWSRDLPFAIKRIMEGGRYIGTEFTLSMLEKHQAEGNQSEYRGPVITNGESQVLELIAEGLTNTQIANRLITSVRTIESRRKKLMEKTNTTNTATLIRFSLKHQLIK